MEQYSPKSKWNLKRGVKSELGSDVELTAVEGEGGSQRSRYNYKFGVSYIFLKALL